MRWAPRTASGTVAQAVTPMASLIVGTSFISGEHLRGSSLAIIKLNDDGVVATPKQSTPRSRPVISICARSAA
jgi:hypothetical protein